MYNKKFIIITIYLYVFMFIFGMYEISRSITLPLIKEYYNFSYNTQGLILSLLTIAYVCCCTLATLLMKYISHKTAIIIGILICGIGFGITGLIDNKIASVGGLIISSLGNGFIEIGVNGFSSIFFTKHSGVLINIEHGIYGVGSLVGPILSAYLCENMSTGFRGNYLVYAISCFVVIAAVLPLKLERVDDKIDKKVEEKVEEKIETHEEVKELTVIECLKDKLVWIYTITLGIQCNVEMAATNWSVLYIKDVLHMDELKVGSLFMTIFYLLFTLARLTTGRLIEKIGFEQSLILTTIGCIILFILGFVFVNEVGLVFLCMTGFFVSPFWPTLMCSVMKVYKKKSSMPTSVIISIQGVFIIIANYIQGVLNDNVGASWGYRSTIVISVLTLLLLFYLNKLIKDRIKLDSDIEMVNIDNSKTNLSDNTPKIEIKVKEEESKNEIDKEINKNTPHPVDILTN